MKLKPFAPPLGSKWRPYTSLRAKTLEPGTEYQASREPFATPAFYVFQQNRAGVKANVEAVCSVILGVAKASFLLISARKASY